MNVNDWLRPYFERHYELHQAHGNLPPYPLALETLVHTALVWQAESDGASGLGGMVRDILAQPLPHQYRLIARLAELHLFESYHYDETGPHPTDSLNVLTDLYLYGSSALAYHILRHYMSYLRRDMFALIMEDDDRPAQQFVNRIFSYETVTGRAVSCRLDNNIETDATTPDESDLIDAYATAPNYMLINHMYTPRAISAEIRPV